LDPGAFQTAGHNKWLALIQNAKQKVTQMTDTSV